MRPLILLIEAIKNENLYIRVTTNIESLDFDRGAVKLLSDNLSNTVLLT